MTESAGHNGSWLRLYVDMPDNVKLRRLPMDTQLVYVWLLCLHKRGQLVGADTKDVAWRLRMTEDEAKQHVKLLTEASLLLPDGTPKGWEERQFVSDSSTERSREWRAKRRETAQQCATQPEPEVKNEASRPPATKKPARDPEPKLKNPAPQPKTLPHPAGKFAADFDIVWQLYPDKAGRHAAAHHYAKARAEGVPADVILAGLRRYVEYVQARQRSDFPDLKYMNGSTWFHKRGWESEYQHKEKARVVCNL